MSVLCTCLFASALVPAPAPQMRMALARPAAAAVSMRIDVPENLENFKAGLAASIGGSLASAPVKAATFLANTPIKQSAYSLWQYNTALLAIELVLYGVVYRYAARSDRAEAPKVSTTIAFSLCRALSALHVSTTPGAAGGGSPFIGSSDMWLQLFALLGESALAFGMGGWAIEYAWRRGWAYKVSPYGVRSWGEDIYDQDMYDQDMYGQDNFRDDFRQDRFLPPSTSASGPRYYDSNRQFYRDGLQPPR